MMRAERRAGEQWDVTGRVELGGTEREGQGTRARGQTRPLTAAAMARMMSGLDEPFGDG